MRTVGAMGAMGMTAGLTLLGCLGTGCMMHTSDPSSMWSEDGREAHQPKVAWPTVRVDGPDGARFTMKRGVFGEALDVRAPFQGDFQPTGDVAMAAYPFDIHLDEATARRYGSDHAVHLKGKLTVPQRLGSRGVLRIAPTECALRALVTGGVDELSIASEVMPTPDLACARAEHSGEMQRGETCSMPAHRERNEGHACGAPREQQTWKHRWHHTKSAAELTLTVVK